MFPVLKRLWSFNLRLSRGSYLLAGVILFLIKFGLDWVVANYAFQRSWSPMNYLIWPDDKTVGLTELSSEERLFALTMLTSSLPFVWTGVMLTLQRLNEAELPRWLTVFFFVPIVNYLLFAVLSVVPARDTRTVAELPRARPIRDRHRRWVGHSYWKSGLISIVLTVPLAVAAVALETVMLGSYGFSLFVGAPFTIGLLASLLVGFSEPRPYWVCLLTGLLTGVFCCFALLAVALEGAICLLMAAPIGAVLITLGSTIGYVIQARPWMDHQYGVITLTLILTLPGLMAAESYGEPTPTLRSVVTEVEIDATPEAVWQVVLEFPPLPEPDDWIFRSGIAYPCRAEIYGHGVGAVRHCIFSTGPFVEPIEVWDAPNLLKFRVTEQPAPMEELSPFHIHPPHLDHYLKSEQGQFKLTRLANGRTLLQGTTWYRNRMWPATYWDYFSDGIIQRIHQRVLLHIKQHAEQSGTR